jgi:lipopolysaccharide transport system ATP-binding protein
VSDVAIRVECLGKQYRIGGPAVPYHTLRDQLRQTLTAPFRAWRRPAQDERLFWALRDVSFEVKRSDVVGIIGRNGAGKSTLLKLLSRITEPTTGEVELHGRVGSLLEVGTGFHQELTGRENVYLNGAILGMKRDEITRKFGEIVAFAEVEKFIDTPVKHYSSGMYMRLAFAVAAHLEPEILIVDEVLAVGDAQFQGKCLGKMGQVARDGRTVLLVSHNMTAIDQLCNVAFWIDRGAIKAEGPAHSVVSQYSASVAQIAVGDMADAVEDGDGAVQPLAYSVANRLGTTTPLPVTGEDVLIRIRLKATRSIARPAYGIDIENGQGVRMLSVNTVELGVEMPPLAAGETEVHFRLKEVPYLPGNYRAGFWVMSPEGHIYLRTNQGAVAFEIGRTRLYGTRDVDQRWGCVFTRVAVSTSSAPA